MSNVVLVGNPKPQSRTLRAAEAIAEELFDVGATVTLDIATFADGLIGPAHDVVESALLHVSCATNLLVASPTYKGTYTGLLKLFLDRLAGGALSGTSAFPLMIGAGLGHALAPELTLRPVLVELGASCPVAGLYLTEDQLAAEETPVDWLRQARMHTNPGRSKQCTTR